MAKKIKDNEKLTDSQKIEMLQKELDTARNRYRQRELNEYGKQKQKEKTFAVLKGIIYDLIELLLKNTDNTKIMETVEKIKEKTAKLKL